MINILAIAQGTGRVVNWSRFKKGELVDQRRISLTPTTVIPDVITDVIALCEKLVDKIEIKTLFPNGFTKLSFDISLKGKGLNVICGRRLIRGGFPFNPFAVEFGANYNVLLAISADDPEVEKQIADYVREKYQCQTE